jgi:hypothetical protein
LDGSFDVYGILGAKFYWTAYGQRTIYDSEPNKSDIEIRGDGPYKWFTKKIN